MLGFVNDDQCRPRSREMVPNELPRIVRANFGIRLEPQRTQDGDRQLPTGERPGGLGMRMTGRRVRPGNSIGWFDSCLIEDMPNHPGLAGARTSEKRQIFARLFRLAFHLVASSREPLCELGKKWGVAPVMCQIDRRHRGKPLTVIGWKNSEGSQGTVECADNGAVVLVVGIAGDLQLPLRHVILSRIILFRRATDRRLHRGRRSVRGRHPVVW